MTEQEQEQVKKMLKLLVELSGLTIGIIKDKSGVNIHTLNGMVYGDYPTSPQTMAMITDAIKKDHDKKRIQLTIQEESKQGYVLARYTENGFLEFMVDRNKKDDVWWSAINHEIFMVFRKRTAAETAQKNYRGESEIWSAVNGENKAKQQNNIIGGL